MLALKTSLSKSYENAPGWAGISPTVVRHTDAAAIQLITRIRNWVKHDVSPKNDSSLGQAILVLPLFIDLMDAIKPGQVLHYATEGFQLPCQGEVRQCLAERCSLLAHLGVIQFTASRPQEAAQGTQNTAKTKTQGQRQSSAHCTANNIKLPEWQWVAPPSQHVHPKWRVYSWVHAPLITHTSLCSPRQAVLQLFHWWLGVWRHGSTWIWEFGQLCAVFLMNRMTGASHHSD